MPTTIAMVASLAALGCGHDETCGVGTAGDTLTATGADISITYVDFRGGPNHDCPDPDAPAGVEAITVSAHPPSSTVPFTLCIPRIDLLDRGDRTVGAAQSAADVWLVDVDGMAGSCKVTLDPMSPPTGTATGAGVCANGTDPRGFELTLSIAATAQKDCAGVVTSEPITIAGTVGVLPDD